MRIAIFTNTFVPHTGGVARSTWTLRSGLTERGHDCLVVAPEFDGTLKDEEGTLRVPAIRNFRGSGYSLRLPMAASVGQAIRDFRPDVVHSQHPFLLGDSALRMAYQWNLPLLYTHHTRYEFYVHFPLENSDWMQRFLWELVLAYERCCDRVIAPSPSIARLLQEAGLGERVSVIPTGIDLMHFADAGGVSVRARRGLPGEIRLIGHVGRLSAEKNLSYLIRSVIEAFRLDGDCHFLLVGEGDEAAHLSALIEESGYGHRFHRMGTVPYDELPGYYSAMDVFAFSSLSETQGLVLAEALASGVPVVALNAPGAIDIVKDEVNGRLISPDESELHFAEALLREAERVKNEPGWREQIRTSVVEYDKAVCLDRLEDLYRSVSALPRTTVPSIWDRFLNRMEGEIDLAGAHFRALLSASKGDGL